MAAARRRIDRGERTAILFGPERAGLENDDLVLANSLVSVPANPSFNSLNLAQCVLICGYEWFKECQVDLAHAPQRGTIAGQATIGAKKALAELLERDLEASGFFWPKEKERGMRLNLRNMIMRIEVTDAEVRTLHGVRRALFRNESNIGRDR